MKTFIIIVVIVGVILGVVAWGTDAKGEGGLTGCLLSGGIGGVGCLYEIIPLLILIAIVMYCCS